MARGRDALRRAFVERIVTVPPVCFAQLRSEVTCGGRERPRVGEGRRFCGVRPGGLGVEAGSSWGGDEVGGAVPQGMGRGGRG